MGVIDPNNMLKFETTDRMFARIRKRLNSFDAAGLLDEGDFYYYVKEVLDMLGVATSEEGQVLLPVKHHKTPLPDNFQYLYAAYSTSPLTVTSQSKQDCFPQEGFAMYLEDTWQPFVQCKGTNCLAAKFDFVQGEVLRSRTYVHGKPNIINYRRPTLLRLGVNARKIVHPSHHNTDVVDAWDEAHHHHDLDVITIDNGFIHTHFEEGHIFMKYYGFAMDEETGMPLVPHNTFIEKAIEDYIIFRVMEDMWFNGIVPDMNDKYKMAIQRKDDSIKTALYYCKLPSFQEAINYIRVQRKNLRIYQQTNFNS
jgi:hypothetical protein